MLGTYTVLPTISIDDDGTLSATKGDSGGAVYCNNTFTPDSDWVASFQLQFTTTSGGVRFGITPIPATNIEQGVAYISLDNSANYSGGSKNSSTSRSQVNIGSSTSYRDFKITSTGSTVQIYVNDTLKQTINDCEWNNDELSFYIHAWNSGTVNVKNVKVKKLSS